MRFTSHNNPNRKRRRRKKSYTDACIDTLNIMLYYKQDGIDLPIDYYNDLAKRRSSKG